MKALCAIGRYRSTALPDAAIHVSKTKTNCHGGFSVEQSAQVYGESYLSRWVYSETVPARFRRGLCLRADLWYRMMQRTEVLVLVDKGMERTSTEARRLHLRFKFRPSAVNILFVDIRPWICEGAFPPFPLAVRVLGATLNHPPHQQVLARRYAGPGRCYRRPDVHGPSEANAPSQAHLERAQAGPAVVGVRPELQPQGARVDCLPSIHHPYSVSSGHPAPLVVMVNGS